eukprot:1160976-Pelagomonas_calceolata.AAC.3
MSLQRSACCRCAASNCFPGLISSQYLIQSRARAAGLYGVGGAVSCGWPVWSSVKGFGGCAAPTYHHFLCHVNQACPPRAFAKSFDDLSSSNIVAFTWERAKWVCGPSEAHCMFLVIESARAIL